METTSLFRIDKTKKSSLQSINFQELEFGKYVSDHMLVSDYNDETNTNGGWSEYSIVPFSNLSLSPTTLALHYGQTVFEGMKAFKMEDGSINIFRINKHYERFAKSLDRMCMAIPPKELFIEGLMQLVRTDADWVPGEKEGALYLRPFIYASEARFGVKISSEFKFIIFTGPVPDLYAKPIKVKVETQYIRAAKGGTGFAKCGGNYGGAFYPTQLARKQGYEQVLWTNGEEDPTLEESGMMNVMFVINNKLYTAPLSDTILDGVTRDSLLTLAADLGIAVEEKSLRLSTLVNALKDGSLTEAFGAGTAAVVAPIKTINAAGIDYNLPDYNSASIHNILKKELTDIRSGRKEDRHSWNTVIAL